MDIAGVATIGIPFSHTLQFTFELESALILAD